jgi:hypothetical protein
VEKLLYSTDSEFLSIQRSERTLNELDAWGRGIPPVEMEELEAGHFLGESLHDNENHMRYQRSDSFVNAHAVGASSTGKSIWY